MSKKKITVNGKTVETQAGLRRVDELYGELEVNVKSKYLFLNKSQDIDVPLFPDDYIIIHGAEELVIGNYDSAIGENPNVRNPVCFNFNGERIAEGFQKAKVSGSIICELEKEIDTVRLFVDVESGVDAIIRDDMTVVIQKKDSYFTIPDAGDSDTVDLEECSKKGRKTPKGQHSYTIKIDREKHKVNKDKITGEEILALADKTYDAWSLNRKFRGGRRKAIASDEIVDLAEPGIERFESVRTQATQG